MLGVRLPGAEQPAPESPQQGHEPPSQAEPDIPTFACIGPRFRYSCALLELSEVLVDDQPGDESKRCIAARGQLWKPIVAQRLGLVREAPVARRHVPPLLDATAGTCARQEV